MPWPFAAGISARRHFVVFAASGRSGGFVLYRLISTGVSGWIVLGVALGVGRAYRLASPRVVRSVANLTRADGEAFLRIAPQAGVRTETQRYPLARANDALAELRGGRVHGAAVLVP